MTYSIDDDRIEEHMQRFCKPDGYCLHCQRPANQHHPVAPITVTISEPDDGDEMRTLVSLGHWAAAREPEARSFFHLDSTTSRGAKTPPLVSA
jgi:hypothetical protein